MADNDPVCGMSVKPDSPHSTIRDGIRYRFCSDKCQAKFEADPVRYVTAAQGTDECPPEGKQTHHGHDHHGAANVRDPVRCVIRDSLSAAGVLSLTGSATLTRPATVPSRTTNITVSP